MGIIAKTDNVIYIRNNHSCELALLPPPYWFDAKSPWPRSSQRTSRNETESAELLASIYSFFCVMLRCPLKSPISLYSSARISLNNSLSEFVSKPKQVFGMPYELRNYNKGPDLSELKELHLHLGGGDGKVEKSVSQSASRQHSFNSSGMHLTKRIVKNSIDLMRFDSSNLDKESNHKVLIDESHLNKRMASGVDSTWLQY